MLLYRVWRYDERYRFPVPFSACTTKSGFGSLWWLGGAWGCLSPIFRANPTIEPIYGLRLFLTAMGINSVEFRRRGIPWLSHSWS